MREILRKQIREKDVMIDNLLARLNPTSSMATPLAISPSRLALTPEQRNVYRDVLAYYEKSQSLSKSATEGGRKFNVSALDEDSEYDSESDESIAVDELQESTSNLHINPLPATEAPAGLLAKTALESKSRLGSPASARGSGSEWDQLEDHASSSHSGGIGNLAYFEPGESPMLSQTSTLFARSQTD